MNDKTHKMIILALILGVIAAFSIPFINRVNKPKPPTQIELEAFIDSTTIITQSVDSL